MDAFFQVVLFAAAAAIIPIITAFLILPLLRRELCTNVPPGPFRWPLFGSLFSLKKPIHVYFSQLSKKYGPLVYIKLGLLPVLLVNTSEMAKEVLKTHDLEFAYRPPTKYFELFSLGYHDIAFSPLSERWKLLRRISSTHLLSNAKLNSSASLRETEIRNQVKSIHKRPNAVRMKQVAAEYNIAVMSSLLFGTAKSEGFRKMFQSIEDASRISKNFNLGELLPFLDRFDLHGIYRKMASSFIPDMSSALQTVIKEHKGENTILDALLKLRDENTIPESSVQGLLIDMIAGGTGTSMVVTEWAMAEVIANKQVKERAQREVDEAVGRERVVKESDLCNLPYIQAIFKETMRLHSGLPFSVPHYNPKPVSLEGYVVPAGTRILINTWAIGRDPAYWTEPEAFKPERFLGSDTSFTGQHFDLIPFSAGRRICAGIPLAARSIPLAIAALCHAFDWEPSQGEVCLDEDANNIVLRMNSELTATASPRLEESAYM